MTPLPEILSGIGPSDQTIFALHVLESVADPVAIMDKNYVIQYQNERHKDMFGGQVGQACHWVVDERKSPCVNCPMAKALEAGRPQKMERWMPSLGRYLEFLASPLRGPEGVIVAGVEIVHDLTTRRLTERALFESEQRFRTIFQSGSVPVIVVSAKSGTVVDANEAVAELLGVNVKALLKNGLAPFMRLGDHEAWKQRLLQYNPPKERFQIPQQDLFLKDGTRLVVSVNASLINLKGESVYYCALQDLSEKVRLDEYLRESMQKLVQTEKMVFLGTMVSGFAHDINNPNQLIALNTSLLADAIPEAVETILSIYGNETDMVVGGIAVGSLKQTLNQAIHDIRMGSDRIAKIVSNLMNFAREGDPAMNDEMDFNSVIQEAIDIIRYKIRTTTTHFEFRPGTGIPLCHGNRQKIEQVTINLIINALDALPDEQCGVLVETMFDEASSCLVLRVTDEGVGMSGDVLKVISEPFFTTKRGRGGSGLGLTVSRVFLKEHGGSLDFESSPGKGTRAIVRLPLRTSVGFGQNAVRGL